jgi:hypothetical protein
MQRRQLVFNLGYDDWREAVEIYEIKQSMIPTRVVHPDAMKYL